MTVRKMDPEERARLEELAARARSEGMKIRRITHTCGHQQGHRIKDGVRARDEYRELARQPCGACSDGSELLDDDGESEDLEDGEGDGSWV